jgi:hypothetical protein
VLDHYKKQEKALGCTAIRLGALLFVDMSQQLILLSLTLSISYADCFFNIQFSSLFNLSGAVSI